MKHERIIGTIAYMGGVMATPEPFTWAWGNMLVYSQAALCQPGERIEPDKSKYSLHDFARNDVLSRMYGDWILMLDTDMAFDPDFAARLVMTMQRYDVDVLTGIYSYKREPHYPVLYLYNPETERHEVIARWDRSSEIFQVHSAGAGCLLVRRRVFERITAQLGENPFDRLGSKGEDHSFFTRLRRLGVKAYCAWKVEAQHLEYVGITPSVHYRGEGKVDNEFTIEGFLAPTPQASDNQPRTGEQLQWQ